MHSFKEIWVAIELFVVLLWTWGCIIILFLMFLYSPFKNINRIHIMHQKLVLDTWNTKMSQKQLLLSMVYSTVGDVDINKLCGQNAECYKLIYGYI